MSDTPFTVTRPDTVLHGEVAGEGPVILLLHGLSATRRYVVHGSRALQRAGYRVVTYDARGHGDSPPAADPGAYDYPTLAADALAVLDAVGADRAVLVGQSMGSATAVAVTLAHPERVDALVVVTPAHRGEPTDQGDRWDALADGFQHGGTEGFVAAYGPPPVPERQLEAIRTVMRQRMDRHRHPQGVAAALRATPRSAAFPGLDALRGIRVPTLIVGSRDELDAEHPISVAHEYAARIPGATLITEDPGESPLAWRGGSLSQAILRWLATTPAGSR
ncbi:MAG: alpha/beta hydrolase [Thermoleophilia bacterium]